MPSIGLKHAWLYLWALQKAVRWCPNRCEEICLPVQGTLHMPEVVSAHVTHLQVRPVEHLREAVPKNSRTVVVGVILILYVDLIHESAQYEQDWDDPPVEILLAELQIRKKQSY